MAPSRDSRTGIRSPFVHSACRRYALEYSHVASSSVDNGADNEQAHSLERQVAPMA